MKFKATIILFLISLGFSFSSYADGFCEGPLSEENDNVKFHLNSFCLRSETATYLLHNNILTSHFFVSSVFHTF